MVCKMIWTDTWPQFVEAYKMDGDRFKHAMEPLLDFNSEASVYGADGTEKYITFRDFVVKSGMLSLINYCAGDEGQVPDVHGIWLRCAIFLARNPSRKIPSFMCPCIAVSPAKGKAGKAVAASPAKGKAGKAAAAILAKGKAAAAKTIAKKPAEATH